MPKIIDDRRTDIDSNAPADSEQLARQEAVKQIERRRRFKISTAVSGVGMILLVAIWAIAEYHNAGGWPSNGFSQSSGIHDVWNFWIIYPLGAWVFLTAARRLVRLPAQADFGERDQARDGASGWPAPADP